MNLAPISARRPQAGFTIVEMMVAVTIGLVVMFGFSVTFVNMKRAFTAQGQHAQLQDSQRLAMSVLTTALSEAGYYPQPWVERVRSKVLVAEDGSYDHMEPGTFIYGKAAAGGSSEQLSTAFASLSGDDKMTCLGVTNTSGAPTTVRNVFYVDAATNTFGCAVVASGAAATALNSEFQPLVSGVTAMSVLYGVDAPGSGSGSVVEYRRVGDMAGHWDAVKSVRLTLTFVNPLSTTAADRTIPWVQTINLMNNR